MSNATVNLIQFDPNLPPGRLDMDRIMFLDFDGVLHPEFSRSENEFCFSANFQDAVRSADPEGLMPIVISSAWRTDSTLESLRSHFRPDIARQIVGVTPDLVNDNVGAWVMEGDVPTRAGIRQREIKSWLKDHAPEADWLAVDDRASYFSDNCENLFLVPGDFPGEGKGLNSMVIQDFQERLEQFLAPPANKKKMRP